MTEDRDNETTERRADESASAFIAWANKYDIGIRDGASDERMTLDMQSVDNVRKQLREGHQIWLDAGRPAERFRTAKVLSTKESGSNSKYLDGEKRTVVAQVWRYLS